MIVSCSQKEGSFPIKTRGPSFGFFVSSSYGKKPKRAVLEGINTTQSVKTTSKNLPAVCVSKCSRFKLSVSFSFHHPKIHTVLTTSSMIQKIKNTTSRKIHTFQISPEKRLPYFKSKNSSSIPNPPFLGVGFQKSPPLHFSTQKNPPF